MKKYKFSKHVEGMVATDKPFSMKPNNLLVFGTSDNLGATISIVNEATGLMYSIPVEAIKKELKMMGV